MTRQQQLQLEIKMNFNESKRKVSASKRESLLLSFSLSPSNSNSTSNSSKQESALNYTQYCAKAKRSFWGQRYPRRFSKIANKLRRKLLSLGAYVTPLKRQRPNFTGCPFQWAGLSAQMQPQILHMDENPSRAMATAPFDALCVQRFVYLTLSPAFVCAYAITNRATPLSPRPTTSLTSPGAVIVCQTDCCALPCCEVPAVRTLPISGPQLTLRTYRSLKFRSALLCSVNVVS